MLKNNRTARKVWPDRGEAGLVGVCGFVLVFGVGGNGRRMGWKGGLRDLA